MHTYACTRTQLRVRFCATNRHSLPKGTHAGAQRIVQSSGRHRAGEEGTGAGAARRQASARGVRVRAARCAPAALGLVGVDVVEGEEGVAPQLKRAHVGLWPGATGRQEHRAGQGRPRVRAQGAGYSSPKALSGRLSRAEGLDCAGGGWGGEHQVPQEVVHMQARLDVHHPKTPCSSS